MKSFFRCVALPILSISVGVSALAAPADSARSKLDFFYFEGQLNSTPVRFQGNSLLEVYKDCMDFAIVSRVANFVDKITINGREITKTFGHWIPETTCAAVTLNARNDSISSSISPLSLGTIEDFPFTIYPHSSTDLRAVLDAVIPSLVSSVEVNHIVIQGVPYSSVISGGFSGDTLRAILFYTARNSGAKLTARGEVAGWMMTLPFRFTGNSAIEIRNQCLDYFDKVQYDLSKIHTFRVNGKTFDRKGWNYWNPQDVCMVIYTQFPRN